MEVLFVGSSPQADPGLRGLAEQRKIAIIGEDAATEERTEFDPDLIGAVLINDDSTRAELYEQIMRIRHLTRRHGIPLIVVAEGVKVEERPRLIAAGATMVCDIDVSPERVFAELTSRKKASDVPTEIRRVRDEMLQPFISAAIEGMQVMAGIDIELDQVRRKTDYLMSGDISAVIYLLGKLERMLAVSVTHETAYKMTYQILGGALDVIDDEVIGDSVAEMANIVAGQVKGQFAGTAYEFDISTPTVIAGENHQIRHRPELPCYVMTFNSSIGRIGLQLAVRPREAD